MTRHKPASLRNLSTEPPPLNADDFITLDEAANFIFRGKITAWTLKQEIRRGNSKRSSWGDATSQHQPMHGNLPNASQSKAAPPLPR